MMGVLTFSAPPGSIFSVFLRNPDLYDDIFFHCTPGTIFKVGRTCRTGRHASRDYVRRKFNINMLLARFFPDPLAFRSVQAQTGTVISGSCALQFLNRLVYPESDIDLYVTAEECFPLCAFIMSEQGGGYTYKQYRHQPATFLAAWKRTRGWKPADGIVPEPSQFSWTGYRSNWIRSVFNFFAKTPDGKRNVQVVVTTFDPLSAILSFHSSVVMNAITVDTAISLFPEATFEENVNLFLGRSKENCADALRKYEKRGWQLEDVVAERIYDNTSVFAHGKRWVQDSYTWRLPLDITGVRFEAYSPPGLGKIGKNNATPRFDTILQAGFNVMYYEEDNLSQVTWGLVNSKIFTNRFIANREMIAKIEFVEDVVIHLAESTHGKVIYSPRICEELFMRWNRMCLEICCCSLHEEENPIRQMAKCAAFKIILSDIPQMQSLFKTVRDTTGNQKMRDVCSAV